MDNVKQVILKDPATGQYLSPKVYGALTYEIQEGGGVSLRRMRMVLTHHS